MEQFAGERSLLESGNSQCPLTLCGKELLAEASGALYWPDEELLIVADLDLSAGARLGERGGFVPPSDPRAKLAQLTRTLARHRPRLVVVLGAPHRHAMLEEALDDEVRALVAELIASSEAWCWVGRAGVGEAAAALGGEVETELRVGGLTLRHRPFVGPANGEIAACYRPAARIAVCGLDLKRPCFVGNGRRLVMPAFASHAGGNNVLDNAFLPLFGTDGLHVWVLGQDGIAPLATRQLLPEVRAA